MESRPSQETVPVFHLSPRTLQEMTSSLCALDCWRDAIITRNIGPDELRYKWLRKNSISSFSCADIASFAVGVRSLIDHKIRLIGKEIKKWWSDHSFLELSLGVMMNCFVFNPAGDICYRRTAKNLLTANPAFSLEKQFEIACKYCFEEDVERLWSSLGNKDYYNVLRGFHVSSNCVGAMDYWCSKMRGELQELYKKANEEQERSPEWFVLSNSRNPNFTNWAQFEYFWHQLNREEQNSLARDVLLNNNCTKHLILQLDDVMLGNLSTPDLKSVLEILAGDEVSYESALQLWSYVNVKNIIVEDESSFYETLVSLSEMAFNDVNSYGFHISSLLKEMWIFASIDFKNHVLSRLSFIEKLFDRSLQYVSIRSFGCDVGFFIQLLCDCASFEIRQHIWKLWWREFFLLARVSDIRELMTLCFDNSDGIVEFKKKYMQDLTELGGIFTEFVMGGFFDELTEYLKFCCSDDEDEKLVREARRKLALQYVDRITKCDSEPVCCKFLKFFNDSVSSADLAELLNWEFQDREANLLSLCILYDKDGLRIFNNALRYFDFPDQRVIELKRFFYERCEYVLMSGDFNSFFVQDWEGFLLWCTSSVENVTRLRDSIAIDDLFESILINMHKFFMDCRDTSVGKNRYSDMHVFDSIDGLLRWYFRDDEGKTVEQFKCDKMMGYENSQAIKMLVNLENHAILPDVFGWLSANNRYELIKFLSANFGVGSLIIPACLVARREIPRIQIKNFKNSKIK